MCIYYIYSDQKHDLYLTDNEKVDPFLVHDATEKSFAGLLTNGPSSIMQENFSNTSLSDKKTYIVSDIDNNDYMRKAEGFIDPTGKSKETWSNDLDIDDDISIDDTSKISIPTIQIREKGNNPFADTNKNNNDDYNNQRKNIKTNTNDQIYKNNDERMNDNNQSNAAPQNNHYEQGREKIIQITKKNENISKNLNSDSMRSDMNKAIQSSYKNYYCADNTLDGQTDSQPKPYSSPDRIPTGVSCL
jgi:hypothetical protein